MRGGDVGVFVASLALLNVVYEGRAEAVQGAMIRKGMGVLRGEGFVDPVQPSKEGEEKEEVLGEKTKDE